MKTLKIVGGGLVALIAILLLVGLVLPKDYSVERSVVIEADQQFAFNHVAELRNWEAWSPWKERDPTVAVTYPGATVGVGATYSWTSDKSGAGTLSVLAIDPPNRMETKLAFDGMGESDGWWTFVPEGSGTRVSWGMKGEMSGPVGGYMAKMMPGWLEEDFDQGLGNLKRVAEWDAARSKKAASRAAAQAAAKAAVEAIEASAAEAAGEVVEQAAEK